jgi:hypothetical protein
MPQQMTPKQLVKAYKIERFETANARVLREDFGFRMRQDNHSKQFGENVWELATTYFYRNQNSTSRQFSEFQAFAGKYGFTVEPLNWWTGARISAVGKETLTFETNDWPKESWAKVLIRIDIQEVYDDRDD